MKTKAGIFFMKFIDLTLFPHPLNISEEMNSLHIFFKQIFIYIQTLHHNIKDIWASIGLLNLVSFLAQLHFCN